MRHPAGEGVELVVAPVQLAPSAAGWCAPAAGAPAPSRRRTATASATARQRHQRADEGGLGPQALALGGGAPGSPRASLCASSPASPFSCSAMGRSSASRCCRARSASRRLEKRSATRADWASARAVSSKRFQSSFSPSGSPACTRAGPPSRRRASPPSARRPAAGRRRSWPGCDRPPVLEHRRVHADAGDQRLALERGAEQLVDAGVGPQLVPEREGRHRGQQRHDEEERRPVAAKRQRSSSRRERHPLTAETSARPWLQADCNATGGEKLPSVLRQVRSPSPHPQPASRRSRGIAGVARQVPVGPPLFSTQGANSMKKLIAALVLATSFAAFADDAAKTPPRRSPRRRPRRRRPPRPRPTPPRSRRRRPRRLPRRSKSFRSSVARWRGGSGASRLTPLARSVL